MLADQTAAAYAETGGGQCTESLPAVGMADGAGQRVGGIGGRGARQFEQADDHGLHLFLGSFTLPDHRLFDLQRSVFGHRQAGMHQCGDGGAARLSEQQGGLGIDVDENLFDGRLLRRVGGDDFADAGKQGGQTLGQTILFPRFDAAAGDVGKPGAGFLDDPVAGDAQAGVDAENAQRTGPQNTSRLLATVRPEPEAIRASVSPRLILPRRAASLSAIGMQLHPV